MRDSGSWLKRLADELRAQWPQGAELSRTEMLRVELCLFLLDKLTPNGAARDGWVLCGGYPYAQMFGHTGTAQQQLMIRRGRYYLTGFRRREEWRRALTQYQKIDRNFRGYEVTDPGQPPQRRQPTRASSRFAVFDRILSTPPLFDEQRLDVAEPGEYLFHVAGQAHSVTIPDNLPKAPDPPQHTRERDTSRAGPLQIIWSDIQNSATLMDQIEASTGGKRSNWRSRIDRIELLLRDHGAGGYMTSGILRINHLMHMVGMVGAGKSTLRDVLAFHVSHVLGLRTAVVVGDVAETLETVDRLQRLNVAAAPILGASTRARHIDRLHRRQATAGASSMLAHQHPGFAYLSSACPLDALRAHQTTRPLPPGENPCTRLRQVTDQPGQSSRAHEHDPDAAAPVSAGQSKASSRHHLCPFWSVCPQHRGARELVDASVWVATPAALVHTAVPVPLTDGDRIRYLELASQTCDLIIVDEADRVQMQLDVAFAPSATLISDDSSNSWLDEISQHKISELTRQNRIPLSQQDVDDWTNAVDTVTAATNRIYKLLIKEQTLRDWISEEYFSGSTMHSQLINEWFSDIHGVNPNAATPDQKQRINDREHLDLVLNKFRDSPLAPTDATDQATSEANEIVQIALQLLHADGAALEGVRQSLKTKLQVFVGNSPQIQTELDLHRLRFEFTLLVSILHHRLNLITILWQRVEPVLRLDNTSNILSRRPPQDYQPIVRESPMGNVLGFQFRPHENPKTSSASQDSGVTSGRLSFFRCHGVGRDLLTTLCDIPMVDDAPTPNVLLMSATSWAGASTRYHVHAPVEAILRPRQQDLNAIRQSTFAKEIVYWPDSGDPIRLSGTNPTQRPQHLAEMLRQLADPPQGLTGAKSILQHQLEAISRPDRRRILLLVGSYDEARRAARQLAESPHWHGRVVQLIPDDSDADNTWTQLRRGDIHTFPNTAGELLIAPLLAVERGHNIILPTGDAAIGAAYFLARPHPRPDDINLAVHAINDWILRQINDPSSPLSQRLATASSPDEAGRILRRTAHKQWHRYITRELAWSMLPSHEQEAFAWDQLVAMWQVIGRLVRGGNPATVFFVDAAFYPREATLTGTDTARTSLVEACKAVLEPYFDPGSPLTSMDKALVKELYDPLHHALSLMP